MAAPERVFSAVAFGARKPPLRVCGFARAAEEAHTLGLSTSELCSLWLRWTEVQSPGVTGLVQHRGPKGGQARPSASTGGPGY